MEDRLPEVVRLIATPSNGSPWYECTICGQRWTYNLLTRGRRPRGWWKCPNGCTQQHLEELETRKALAVQ